ncbi:hypothetical protein AF72_04170 [Xylella taiwanensis]|uniref:Uncharacterized protein n=1 Tax=Xylella taiwanensis TaxID=1444770 RepID=Z9JL97_9GAMM|nr:hypothetical protein AB672_03745 [Xylella taiwanensis]EWS78773.1 hypothetical protein AF72_04170 [Xylella taiwanensis]
MIWHHSATQSNNETACATDITRPPLVIFISSIHEHVQGAIRQPGPLEPLTTLRHLVRLSKG